ncbi:MAG: hypothetical protein B0A82_24855 [Alkalinema sp. CACIAM 70d]|nr:MAG: hypothetical protein B0A82_24855 [Alkalinema sp. CACIAM 70d]
MFSSRQSWYVVGVAYGLTFGLILYLAYQGLLPTYLTQNDKLAHFVLYGLMTFVGQRVTNDRCIRLGRLRMPLFPIGFFLFTTIEEACQGLSPNRSLDAGDLVMSYLGIVAGFWLDRWLRRQQR